MREVDRIDDFLNRLAFLWRSHPDMRFLQLVMNVFDNPAAYYLEDDKVIEALEAIYNN